MERSRPACGSRASLPARTGNDGAVRDDGEPQARMPALRESSYCGSGVAKTPVMNSFKPTSEPSCRNL
jgi:hypothetical protein